MYVVATGPNLVEAGGIRTPVLGRPPLHRVEPEARDLLAFDQPRVGAVFATDHTRDAVLVLGDDMLGEEVAHGRGLDDVVVDTDEDEVFNFHLMPPGPSRYPRA